MYQVLEIVEFKAIEGTKEAEFIAAASRALNHAKSMEGFCSTSLASDEDGNFINIVKWQSMSCAKNAAEVFHTLEETRDFMMLIDANSVKMRHVNLNFEIIENSKT